MSHRASAVAQVCLALGLASSCVPREREPSKAEPKHETKRETKPIRPRVDPRLRSVFEDNFNRAELGEHWRALADSWKIEAGQLCGQGARNHPIWLKKRLPVNAIVEFQATSYSPEGDIKSEFWGDGRSAAAGVSYKDATSYLAVLGGWKNKLNVLARLDEHGSDRLEIKLKAGSAEFNKRTVAANQKYQFRVERRDGKTVDWFVDDQPILSFADKAPLSGSGHEHFGFNDWQVRVCFDNLKVTPLSAQGRSVPKASDQKRSP